jgi:hypothetical protein
MKNIFFTLLRSPARARLLGIVVAAIASALAVPSHAQQCVTLEDFSSSTPNSFPAGWTPREEAGRKVYTVMKEGEMLFVRARSVGAGIEADRPVKWNIQEYPILRWQWRPRVFPRGANEYNGKDDSVLGVYIGFCPPEDVDFCERSIRGKLSFSDRLMLPKLMFSKGVGSLKYIWSEQLAKGFEFENGRKAVKVLESGVPANRERWVQARVNVAAEYRKRLGGEKLLNPVGISILTDSDDTQSEAEGDYADFQICRG